MSKHLVLTLGSIFLVGSIAIAVPSTVGPPTHRIPAGIPRLVGLLPDDALPGVDSGVWQLRIYTINRGHLDDFANAWLKGVYPLRVQHGFHIPAAWTIKESNQFVWLVGYAGPEEWDAKEAAYYGSVERIRMDPDPRQWIARAEAWFVNPVLTGG